MQGPAQVLFKTEKFPINYTEEKIRYRTLTAIRHDFSLLGLFEIYTNCLLPPG